MRGGREGPDRGGGRRRQRRVALEKERWGKILAEETARGRRRGEKAKRQKEVTQAKERGEERNETDQRRRGGTRGGRV